MPKSNYDDERNMALTPYNGDFISKSNILINGKYRSSLQMNRINYINNLKLQTGNYLEDPETHELCVSLYPSEITKMLNLKKGGSIYQSLDGVARQLLGTYIGVTDAENERFRYINLVTESVYEDGVLVTKYNPHMKNYLVNLKQNFTKLPRDLMMSWTSTASYRLYELMKQRAYYPKSYTGTKNGIFTATYDVYELRLLLGVVNSNLEAVRRILDGTNPPDYKKACEASPEKMYEDWSAFRRSIIDKAVKEINANENSDIELQYTLLKKKHGEVYAIEFKIYLKDMYKKREDNIPEVPLTVDREGGIKANLSQADIFIIQVEAMNILSEFQVKPDDVLTICEKAAYDIEKIKKIAAILATQKDVDNVVGWILAAVERNYSEPVTFKGKKRNQFLEYQQHDYPKEYWKELEEELIANQRRGEEIS